MVKDILQSWFKYTQNTAISIGSVKDVIIWFNSDIKIDNQVIFYRNIFDKGIHYVHHFLNENGELYSNQEFNLKYGSNINFLTYHGIISALPDEWKHSLKLDERNNSQVHIKGLDPKCLSNIHHASKVCKKVYDHFIIQTHNAITATGLKKWETYFGKQIVSKEGWDASFTMLYRLFKSTEVQLSQFKLLHYSIATNELLFKWKLVDSDICVFCEEDIETLTHLFLECEVIKLFWKDLEIWISTTTQISYGLNLVEKVFGITIHQNLDILNIIYLIAKKFIYKCKYDSKFPCLTEFIYYIKYIIQLEKSIALVNITFMQFSHRWQDLQLLI